ncbi:MAG: MoxR family ATPase [Victivallales bacterium]|nr:MoxR family ATPase [Victivallales bacterium]
MATENPNIQDIVDKMTALKAELAKVVVGQRDVIDQIIITLLAGGHALLTGVPGLGKTLLVKSVAQLFSLSFKRIQFTPDLMPADIFGTEVLQEDPATGTRAFKFIPGPVFANIVLADEINRTPPKTQAALLEAMGEYHVTSAGKTIDLERPFFVLATQNPIELEGTYPLPEAQLDRFLLNIVLNYLPVDDEVKMVRETTSPEAVTLSPILNGDDIVAFQKLVREVPVSDNVVSYAVRLAAATRPNTPNAAPRVNELVKWGAGSRASQALILAGKARALLDGRRNVACEDVRALAIPVFRHRVITNFRAEAENISTEALLQEIIASIQE